MLRLVEHYISVQGEGPRVGLMTQFVRFAGCNMRCPGWPCDTEHAIDPKIWRVNSFKQVGLQLADQIAQYGCDYGAYNVCFTGGEPFLQPSQELFDATAPLANRYQFEVFTNGSFEFPDWTKTYPINMQYMMDWKLPGSGEYGTALDQRRANVRKLDQNDGIKFVVVDEGDLEFALGEAEHIRNELQFKGQFWVAAAWSRISDKQVIQFMKDNKTDWRLNIQMHKHIWPAEMQGV